jgi:hypothetical protein
MTCCLCDAACMHRLITLQSCATHHPSIPRALVQDEPTEWQSNYVCVLHPARPGQFRILGQSDDQIMRLMAEKITSFKSSPVSLGISVFDGHSTSSEVRIDEKATASSEEETCVEQDEGPPVDRGRGAWGYVIATTMLETVIWVSLSIIDAPPFRSYLTCM